MDPYIHWSSYCYLFLYIPIKFSAVKRIKKIPTVIYAIPTLPARLLMANLLEKSEIYTELIKSQTTTGSAEL